MLLAISVLLACYYYAISDRSLLYWLSPVFQVVSRVSDPEPGGEHADEGAAWRSLPREEEDGVKFLRHLFPVNSFFRLYFITLSLSLSNFIFLIKSSLSFCLSLTFCLSFLLLIFLFFCWSFFFIPLFLVIVSDFLSFSLFSYFHIFISPHVPLCFCPGYFLCLLLFLCLSLCLSLRALIYLSLSFLLFLDLYLCVILSLPPLSFSQSGGED